MAKKLAGTAPSADQLARAMHILDFFRLYARLRGADFGAQYLDAEYWRILNCLRQYPPGYRVGLKELEKACGMPEGKLTRRLLSLEAVGWLSLETMEIVSRKTPKLRSAMVNEALRETFDEHVAKAMRLFAESFLPANEYDAVEAAVHAFPRPIPDKVVETFLHSWLRYGDSWRRLVRDLFLDETWSGSLEALRLKLLEDEIHWLIVICQPLVDRDTRLSEAFVDFNGLVAAMNQFAVVPVAKVREDIADILKRSNLLESELCAGGARSYRLRERERWLVVEHLAEADDIFRESSAHLPRIEPSRGEPRIRLVEQGRAAS